MTRTNNQNIRLYKERLNVILDVAQTINEEHSVDALISEFELILREELNVPRVLVFIRTEHGWESLLTSGVGLEAADRIDVERDLLPYRTIQTITMSDQPVFEGFDAVIPLYHKYKPIGFVLIGDIDDDIGISPTIKHLKFIQIIANLIVVFIENKRMQNTLLKQEAIRHELELASRIQAGLVPTAASLPQSSRLLIRSLYHPHLGVGGDYYDVINLSRYSVGFCIADVSGKGMAAALLMSNFQAVVRSVFTPYISLRSLVKKLNARVNNSSSNEKFITFFVGRYNKVTGRLHYINAGHLPPILYDPSDRSIRMLDKGCLGLGMFDTIPTIEVGSVTVHQGARLLAFTDGLVEIQDTPVDERMFSITSIVSDTTGVDDMMRLVHQDVDEYISEGLIADDISALGIEFLRNGLLSYG